MSKTKNPSDAKQHVHVKHGLYARYFNDLEASALAEIGEGIDDELKALRIAAARLFERASEQGRDWESEMRLLDAFGRQCVSVAALVRTRKLVNSIAGETDEIIQKAFLVAGGEWNPLEEK